MDCSSKVAFQLCLIKALEISGAAEQKSVCVWLVFHGMETPCKQKLIQPHLLEAECM